jgi:putative intracellular protease/amidase
MRALFVVCLFLAISVAATNVLVLMPSQAFLRLEKGTFVRSGSHLNEVTIPAMFMRNVGFHLTVATPQGNKPPMNPQSNTSSDFPNTTLYNDAVKFWNTDPALNNPIPLSFLAVEDPEAPINSTLPLLDTFDGLFIPGGHAPIIDLFSSTAVARILAHFVDHKKPIGAICHGPLVLASLSLLRTPWDFEGKNMTVFSTVEEKVAEKSLLKGKLGFYPQEVLENLGGNMAEAAPMSSNVVVCGFLITAQNPPSAEEFANAFVNRLQASGECRS